MVQLDFAPSKLEKTRLPDLALAGDIGATLTEIRESAVGDRKRTAGWIEELRRIEAEKRGRGAGAARRRPLPDAPDAGLQGAG